ncbi:MAG: hypothetical protein LBD58_04275 [Treponema sp.]|jgi:hypothetical protein|nr:hypothetical protein [Treponema sp.]
MHTNPFFAKSSAKFLNISLQALFITSLISFSACSSIGVSGMYAATTAIPPSSTKAQAEDAEKVFGGTLFTDATVLGSEISYFTGENVLTGNKASGVDFGLAFKIPISIKRVTITPFAGADYRFSDSMQQIDSETDMLSDLFIENMWLKTGLSIDYAFTNTLFLRAEAGYGKQLASGRQKERYSISGFFAPGYGLKFRIGFGTYVGSAKKNFSKKKPAAAASKPPASTTPSITTASPSKPPAAPTTTTRPVSDTPSPSKKTTNSGAQIYAGETYKCQFSSQDNFQLFALKDIPSRYSSLTIFTDGVKDTMIAIITIEGAQAIANQGTVQVLFDNPDRYILALDDDSGKNANANVNVNVPRERAFIVMVLNKDKSAGNYTLTVNGNEGSRENGVEVISPSEKTPIIYANKTYERTFTSSDSSIHLYGLSGVGSYNSLTIYTEGKLDTGLVIISANGAQTLVDTGDPSQIQSKDILGYDADSGADYNARVTITPPRDGTCFIIVTTKGNGTYRLTVKGN